MDLKKVFGLILVPNGVLIRNILERGGAGKLQNYWEKDIYVVVSSDLDLRIYNIKQHNGSKPIQKVHRNLLLKYNELHFEKSSFFSKLKVLSPQKPLGSL